VRLVIRLARENSSWGYDRISGAITNLGHKVSDQTVGNVLRRHGITPAPKRSQTTAWKDFIASHVAVITGMNFFTVEILTWRGLITYYILFAIQLETRRVMLAGVTRHPTGEWMGQVARNLTDSESSTLGHQKYICMIAIRSSAPASDPRDRTEGCSRSDFRLVLPI
jgi:putative transposase